MRSLSALSAFAVVAMSTLLAVAADLELVLLHVNDMHSRFDETDVHCNECRENDAALGKCYGGFARVAEVVRAERQTADDRGAASLFAVAGDTFQGTPYFSFYKWKPVVEFINQLGPDVMTLGNHEFDDGINSLLSYLEGIKNIPTVVSNLDLLAEPKLDRFILKSKILEVKNTKVGIVGYLTTDTPTTSSTGAAKFFDEIEPLKRETKKLRDEGVKIIIALGHSGIEKDQIIAKEVEDIDLIVGGHSHTFLYTGNPPSIEKPYGPYPLFVKNAKNKSIPIIQAYSNTKYVGKVNLRFDSDGELIHIDGSPILLDKTINQDKEMLTVLNKWKSMIIQKTNATIGRTTVELMNMCHDMECNMGNLIADSFVYYNVLSKNTYGNYWTDAPIGIIQAGGIRTSINETDHDGYITLGQLMNVTPFTNKLIKITIPGSNILEAFEHSVYEFVENSGRRHLLQVSGIIVEFDLTKRPGNRVSSLRLRCGECSIPKFEPLILTANYTIVVSDYLANGGDNYKALSTGILKREYIDVEDYNATATYMKSISPIMVGLEGRISFKENNNTKSKAYINTWNSQLLLVAFSSLLYSYI